MEEKKIPQAPRAFKKPHEVKVHGVTLRDDYFWLRDRGSPEVLDYLKAENAYLEEALKPTEEFQKKLYGEMLSRIKETDLSVPVRRGEYFYYSRIEQGWQYPLYARKRGSLESPEEILLDLNVLAQNSEYFSLGSFSVSSDHRLLLYSTDTTGAEQFTLRIRDLTEAKDRPESLADTGAGALWAEDGRTIFYTLLDEMKRPYKLMRHVLGTRPEEDVLVFHEKDDGFLISIEKTRDRKFLILNLSSKTSSEVHVLEADRPEGDFRLIHGREKNMEYTLEHESGRFLILTNDEAENFRLMEAPVSSPEKASWKELIAHRPQVRLEGLTVCRDYLVVFERFEGLIRIWVQHHPSGEAHYVDFDEPVYTVWEGSNPEFETRLLRFGYSSLVTPDSVFDYDLKTRSRELKKQQEVLGGYDPCLYRSERLKVPSHDGTLVPVSMVYRKDLKKTSAQPLLLYGYGSYGISIDPVFSSNRLSLLDRGFIFAIAHIRGGGDLGRPWYLNGKFLNKKNTFKDFIACAEYLIAQGVTSQDQLIISGGSAGGLLMGAVVNERPELFHGAILHVPFVDVINTMLDPSLPLTVPEYEEWGNPQDKNYFDLMLSYSPYDNIKAQNYPHMLVTGGLNDPRVQYWEPAKWTAKLREIKTDQHLLLMKIHMGAGHAGASGRYDYLKEVALDYAFIFHILKIL